MKQILGEDNEMPIDVRNIHNLLGRTVEVVVKNAAGRISRIKGVLCYTNPYKVLITTPNGRSYSFPLRYTRLTDAMINYYLESTHREDTLVDIAFFLESSGNTQNIPVDITSAPLTNTKYINQENFEKAQNNCQGHFCQVCVENSSGEDIIIYGYVKLALQDGKCMPTVIASDGKEYSFRPSACNSQIMLLEDLSDSDKDFLAKNCTCNINLYYEMNLGSDSMIG